MNRPHSSSSCICCGKPLTDALSMELGMGPVCRISVKTMEAMNPTGNLFNPRCSYAYTVEEGVVCIVDTDNGKSVTNDAEAVIADLAAAGVDVNSNRVIYRDTMGVWDRLEVKGGRFLGFTSINEREKAAAKAKVLCAEERKK